MKPLHAALALVVAAIWGANFVVIDVGLKDFPPLLFSALRFLLAALPAVFLVGRPRVAWRWVLTVGLVLGVMKFSLLFIGMKAGMPAGLSSLVLQVQAVLTVAFAAVLLRERPRRAQLVGLGIAACGIVMVGASSSGSVPLKAFLLIIAAGVCWGLANVATRKAGPPDMFRFMVWVSAVPPIPLLLLSGTFEGVHQDLDALRGITFTGIASTVYVAWAATLFGYAAWGYLIRAYGTGAVAPYALAIPIFGMATAWAAQGERMTPSTGLAALLVIAGIAVSSLWPSGGTVPLRRAPEQASDSAAPAETADSTS
ncbi:EamA family transporter [Streptacidiphilus cavernicola]|uniref:EamA family transporter n=1 Tax=Streptacidiphilus cavernicola TaxID=3342716 RepID=A0ABV6VYY7_9ACTN